VLELARLNDRTVKVVGAGYSSNGINCTDGYMVSLKNINKVVQVAVMLGLRLGLCLASALADTVKQRKLRIILPPHT